MSELTKKPEHDKVSGKDLTDELSIEDLDSVSGGTGAVQIGMAKGSSNTSSLVAHELTHVQQGLGGGKKGR